MPIVMGLFVYVQIGLSRYSFSIFIFKINIVFFCESILRMQDRLIWVLGGDLYDTDK